jgi:Lrp/AsnC family leucine-responsive transcriptional regulator
MKQDLTKLGDEAVALDETDRHILVLLQDDCKRPLTEIGEAVGMSAPSVLERVRKLEQHGVIKGYHARVDARRIGLDLWAFVGVTINFPKSIEGFKREVVALPEVLECHHVTGEHTMLIKIKTKNTASLELLLSGVRSLEGVTGTQTMVVLSTLAERATLPLEASGKPAKRSPKER